jgi:hypothetical protein
MTASPFFRCRYESAAPAGGLTPFRIRGRFEFRRPSLSDTSVSSFSRPHPFHLDTGAVETAVDEQFALAHGFGHYRQLGAPLAVSWFNAAAPAMPAWRLYRWVRFRDYTDGVPPFPASDSGGLAHLEFRIAVLVVPNVTIPVPLFGVHDMHNYFGLVSNDQEYTFYPKRKDDGNYPTATDGGQGVRKI